MNLVISVLGTYFSLGLLVLCILEIATGRIRRKLRPASIETRVKLAASGNFVGGKTSVVVVLIALWLFWPVAIYGALTSPKKEKQSGE